MAEDGNVQAGTSYAATSQKTMSQIAMTLAALAYAPPAYLAGYFTSHDVVGQRFSLIWQPDPSADPVNFAFIVQNIATSGYMVAIRGTYPDPLSSAYWADGAQDNPFGTMQPWPNAASSGACVSAGTWAGLQSLLGLTGDGRSLQAVLQQLGDVDLCFTGHSLGGTLAPVLALWDAERFAAKSLCVYAFAGMTPGNAAFADLFAQSPVLADRVWRYNNTLDTVPYGWDRVLDTRSFYTPAPKGGLVVEALLTGTALLLAPYGYAAVGVEIQLPGKLLAIPIRCELVAYVIENLHQHLPDTYLTLLGAPPIPLRIGFGPYVVSAPPQPSSEAVSRRVVYALT
ncbi:MAG TPA: hypothetical protein PLY97_01470 [Acidocella sp.]|nr:hypothetical protein [Acidocella sp.]